MIVVDYWYAFKIRKMIDDGVGARGSTKPEHVKDVIKRLMEDDTFESYKTAMLLWDQCRLAWPNDITDRDKPVTRHRTVFWLRGRMKP